MKIVAKKRWYLKVIFHALDIWEIDGCLLFHRHCDQQEDQQKRMKNHCLNSFQIYLVNSDLWERYKNDSQLVGRPEKWSFFPTPNVGKKATIANPFPDIRYDLHGHFPDFNDKRRRCLYCPKWFSNIYCWICKDGNWLYLFHH